VPNERLLELGKVDMCGDWLPNHFSQDQITEPILIKMRSRRRFSTILIPTNGQKVYPGTSGYFGLNISHSGSALSTIAYTLNPNTEVLTPTYPILISIDPDQGATVYSIL
jgi:hypothetical protein